MISAIAWLTRPTRVLVTQASVTVQWVIAATCRAFWSRTFRRHSLPDRFIRELLEVATGLGDVVTMVYARLFRARSLIRAYRLETIVEPAPNPHSRLSLSTERDQLGLNRVRLDWRLDPLVTRTLRRVHQILDEELRRAQLGRVDIQDPGDEGSPLSNRSWCWHHMGTTRMDPDPKRGVVDEHCRVHGIANLFIAGSSVFPTAGSDTPTVTIVALAIRLADRLKTLLRTGILSA